jgi:hypothetical protein
MERSDTSTALVRAPFDWVVERLDRGPAARSDSRPTGPKLAFFERTVDGYAYRATWDGNSKVTRVRRTSASEWTGTSELELESTGRFAFTTAHRVRREGDSTRIDQTTVVRSLDGRSSRALRLAAAFGGPRPAIGTESLRILVRELEAEYFVDFGGPPPHAPPTAVEPQRAAWFARSSEYRPRREAGNSGLFLVGTIVVVVGGVALAVSLISERSLGPPGVREVLAFLAAVSLVVGWTAGFGSLDAARARRLVDLGPAGLKLSRGRTSSTIPWEEFDLGRAVVRGNRIEIPCPPEDALGSATLDLSFSDARRVFESLDRPPAQIHPIVLARVGLRRPERDRIGVPAVLGSTPPDRGAARSESLSPEAPWTRG